MSLNRRDFIIGSSLLLSNPAKAVEQKTKEYEYIIIGSGAGGGPLAANLARAGKKVLLIEAGPKELPLDSVIPAHSALSTENKHIAWDFYVNHYSKVKDSLKDHKYVENKGILYPRSQGIGGCTIHNAMITMYPNNGDFDQIVDITGDRSWNSINMRKYFQRLENCNYRKQRRRNKSKNGFSGWLSTEQSPNKYLLKDKRIRSIFQAALYEEGVLDEISDLFSSSSTMLKFDPNDWRYVQNKIEGLIKIPKATHQGKRSGPRQYILKTQRQFPQNLHILTDTFVSKLIFKEGSKDIDGVEVLTGKNLYSASPLHNNFRSAFARKDFIRASKEVVVCGGAFNSPQLLMLSGIGPAKHLKEKGINCKVNLPGVGENLQDRYELGIVSELKKDFKLFKGCQLGLADDPCLKDYFINPAKSVYSSNGFIIGLNKKSTPLKENPDLLIFAIPGDFRGYRPGWSKDLFNPKRFTWLILKTHTDNTSGTVRLRSKNPLNMPEINFNHFYESKQSYKDDLNALIKGVKIARSINSRNPLRGKLQSEVFPGNRVKSDFDIEKFSISEAWGHHASCSNKMGRDDDKMSVVDSEFRVKGVGSLRVVDASVFPRIPGHFIALPIYMISEKATDSILGIHD